VGFCAFVLVARHFDCSNLLLILLMDICNLPACSLMVMLIVVTVPCREASVVKQASSSKCRQASDVVLRFRPGFGRLFSLERGRRSADPMPARDAILHTSTFLVHRAY
jgi:hypothetical protein